MRTQIYVISLGIFLALFASCVQNTALPQPTAPFTQIPTLEPTASVTPLPTLEPTPTRPATGFEVTKCRTSTRARLEIECGELTVPEDRSRPEET